MEVDMNKCETLKRTVKLDSSNRNFYHLSPRYAQHVLALLKILSIVLDYMPYHTIVKILALVLGFIIPSSFVSQVYIHNFLILGSCSFAKLPRVTMLANLSKVAFIARKNPINLKEDWP